MLPFSTLFCSVKPLTFRPVIAELSKSGALASLGIEPVAESGEQYKRYIASDVAQGAELLKSAGFKPE
jgi:tripartite-type tricarboxylate transporter receptor subunit TctC